MQGDRTFIIMSEQQTGQSTPENGGMHEQATIDAYYYDYVGGFLASEDTPQIAFGTDPQAMRDVFVGSQGNYLTPANTFRVLEHVVQGPIDLVSLKANIPIAKTAVTRTVNYLSTRGVVGKSEWMFALDPEPIRETSSRVPDRHTIVNAVVQTAESLTEGRDGTMYVTKEQFLEHLAGRRPDLSDKQQAIWNRVVFEIQRQYKAWTNGIEFTSSEAHNKRQATVALTPVFQHSVREMMTRFADLKQNFSTLALKTLQKTPLVQKTWNAQQQRFEYEQQRDAALRHCADVAIKGSVAVDAILAIGDGEFDIKDAFWPRMIFGFGYEPRRQQVPWHSWR